MNVGRAFVSIAPDTSKFRAQLVRELKPLVAAAEKQVGQVKITASVNTGNARRALEAFARQARQVGNITVTARVNTGNARRALESFARQVQQVDGSTANIDLKARSAGVQEEVRREVVRAERKGPIRLRMEVDKRGLALASAGLLTAFTIRDLSQFVVGVHAIAAAVQPATTALVALGAAAIGVTAALSPLVGLLPALAVGASALGQGVGVAAAAFSGIGGALKAYKQTQDAAATSTVTGMNAAKAAARAQVNAARQLRDALTEVDDARRSSAEAVVAASERVDDAERSLTRSQEAARRAQDDLNEARREAREELEDLQLAVERSALGEQRAHLRLEEARVRLRRVRVLDASSGGRASRQLRDATLDVAEADLSVREAVERRGDEQERLNKLTKNGIDGSERVIDAQDRIRAANEQVLDSRRALLAAEVAVTRAQEQGARRIVNALENVERAHESVADAAERVRETTTGATAGVNKFKQAMDGLSPAARSFVNTLLSFQEPLKRLRDVAAANLFPGLERGLEAMRPLFAVFEPIVASTARTLGNLGERFGKLMASPFFRGAFTTLGRANVRILESLGDAALALAPAITQILLAAVPLAEAMARLASRASETFASFIDGEAKSGGLARFFESTEKAVRLLWGVMEPFIRILFGVGKAAKSTGEFVLTGIGRALDELAGKVNSAEGQAGLKTFFESLWPAITESGRLIVDVARAFADFAKDGAPRLAPLIKQVREELLPAVIDLVNKAEEHGPKIIEFITKIVELLAVLPIGAIVDTLLVFFNLLIDIANIPNIGPFLFTLASAFSAVRIALWALAPLLRLLPFAIGPVGVAFATAALLIIANWEKVAPVFEWVKDAVIRSIGFLGNYVLAKIEWITRGLAAAFGWLPLGIGDDLKAAAKNVERFRDDFNRSIAGLVGEKTIKIKLEAFNPETAAMLQGRLVPGRFQAPQRRHEGINMGPIRGRPGQTDVPLLARTGEYVVTEQQMAKMRGGDGAAALVTNHTWNITAIPVGDLPTEIPRRIRDKQHLWT